MKSVSLDKARQGIVDDGVRSPNFVVEGGELTEQLQRKILELSPQQQEVLRLRLHDNLTYKQIAQVMDISVSHVGVQLHQAIVQLRRMMQS